MTKKITIILFLIILTGCSKTAKIDKTRSYEKDTAQNITMTIKEGTLTNNSATVIIKDLSGQKNYFGEDFVLYKKKNNKWYYLKTITNGTTWITKDYHTDENNLLEMRQSWKGYWGTLKPGQYKLVKGAFHEGEMDAKTFSTDFVIK